MILSGSTMRNDSKVPLLQTLLVCTAMIGVLLLITYIWVPDALDVMLIWAIVAPFILLVLGIPIFLTICMIAFVWRVLTSTAHENSEEE